jgi:pyruvate dehydrogenase E1 component alpha subunit
LTEEYKKEITGQFLDAEKNKAYPYDDVFDHMYTDMPDELKRQKAEYEEFLNWKENRR